MFSWCLNPIPTTPFSISVSKPSSPLSHFRLHTSAPKRITNRFHEFKSLGGSKTTRFTELGFRVSAGGNDGGGSNSGGGGSGSGDGSGGGGHNKRSFLSWYLAALENYPVLTKALTSAILTFIGDLICQLLIDQVSTLDVKRTLLFTLLGFVLVGPTLHFWYLSLSKLIGTPGASGAVLRLLLDQFLFSPIFIGFFLCTLLTLEGRPSQIFPKLQQEWLATVLANWQLWIPFQFLNFLFVPQQFQELPQSLGQGASDQHSLLCPCRRGIHCSCSKYHCSSMECDSFIQSSQRNSCEMSE